MAENAIRTEDEWGLELSQLVGKIQELPRAYERAYEVKPLRESIRAADDIATGSLSIGQYVQYCLAQAVDACVGIEHLVSTPRGLAIPLVATYPLARTAIESACTALWVMRPPARRERVLRRLQATQDELAYEKSFIVAASASQQASARESMKRVNAKGARETRRQMRRVADASGIEWAEYERGLPGWEKVVDEAGDLFNVNSSSLLVGAWKFTSGLTHPSFMRGLVAHEFLQTADSGDAEGAHEVRGRLTGDPAWITSTATAAQVMTLRAIAMLRVTKAMVNGERPVPSPRT
ncbi:hypothetical protein ITJ57_05645 [Plantibacter sp. VKM Ac-2880]|uniref:hypothetical protein n=1 Tax=Plantibacter sp. VKM Ac-2880 TaxID=2783827 RepID=UPI00188FF9B2|nr:hypothetical protein [Plantibacter sp. VKM Ac-2880]MBF4568248.1 hypothetical protein [Plantibacter sp. VKM Ac-2880]